MGRGMCRFRARIVLFLLPFLAGLCFGAPNGVKQVTVPAGTLLRVEVIRRTRLQENQPIEGRLLDPVYAENRMLIPSGATLEGTISALLPAAHGRRLEAKFHGDFTPLDEPVIQWTAIECSDGSRYPLLGRKHRRRRKHTLLPQGQRVSPLAIPACLELAGGPKEHGGRHRNRAAQMGSAAKILLVANALPSAICGGGFAI